MLQMTWHMALNIVGCVMIVIMIALGATLPYRGRSLVSVKKLRNNVAVAFPVLRNNLSHCIFLRLAGERQ